MTGSKDLEWRMPTGVKVQCLICQDVGWVCEDHNDVPWGYKLCCGGAGVPCSGCNSLSRFKLAKAG